MFLLFADVSEYVGELVGEAERQRAPVDRLGGRRGVRRDAHDRHRHEADGAGDVVAVEVELVEGAVAGLGEVEAHPLDHVPERLDVDGEGGDGVGERGVEHVVGAPGEGVLQPRLPPVERQRRHVRRVRPVHQLVRSPTPHCIKSIVSPK
uniref:Uncharacterized protein n=1 Tax=Oryza brachyantha TaxID=4533 RepID=J3MZZ8_ORYBR